jgi:LPXTG-motif cell wall-anchored protein
MFVDRVRRTTTDHEGAFIVSIARRLFTVAAIVSAAVAAVPVAAQAVVPTGSFSFQVNPDSLQIEPTGGEFGRLILDGKAGSPASLTDVAVVVDFRGLAGFAGVYWPARDKLPGFPGGDEPLAPGCTIKESVLTCEIGTVTGTNGHYPLSGLYVAATKGAKVGDAGALKVTLRSNEAAPLLATATVEVVRDVDLGGVSKSPGSNSAEPVAFGADVRQPIGVSNAGSFVSRGAGMILSYDRRFVPAARYSNCGYDTDARYTQIFCKFTDRIPVGATYQLDRPMLKLRPDATPNVVFSFGWNIDTLDTVNAEGDAWYRGHKTTPGTGPALHLVPMPGAAPVEATPAGDDEAAANDKDADLNGVNNMAQGWVLTPKKAPPSHAATAASGNQAAGAGAGADGGGLPVTGSNAMLLGGAGLVLLAAGAGAFLFTRRRRSSFTA